jgi:23S rRNA G2445 N2-methylase RlmL
LRPWRDDPPLVRWDARRLPLPDSSIGRIVTNPPFGKQLGDPAQIGPLYHALVSEWQRVLKPGGQATVLVSDLDAMQQAAWSKSWQQEGLYRIRLLGHPAAITVWRTPYTL